MRAIAVAVKPDIVAQIDRLRRGRRRVKAKVDAQVVGYCHDHRRTCTIMVFVVVQRRVATGVRPDRRVADTGRLIGADGVGVIFRHKNQIIAVSIGYTAIGGRAIAGDGRHHMTRANRQYCAGGGVAVIVILQPNAIP